MYIVGKARHPHKEMAFILWLSEAQASEIQVLLDTLRGIPKRDCAISKLKGFISPVQLWFTAHPGILAAVCNKAATGPVVAFEVVDSETGTPVFEREKADAYSGFLKAQTPTRLVVSGAGANPATHPGGITLSAYINDPADRDTEDEVVETAWIAFPTVALAAGLTQSTTNILPLWVKPRAEQN